MLKLKHLKTLQNVSISIQIIFREFVVSSLKSLNLKFFKIVVKWQHYAATLPRAPWRWSEWRSKHFGVFL